MSATKYTGYKTPFPVGVKLPEIEIEKNITIRYLVMTWEIRSNSLENCALARSKKKA